MNLLDLVKAAPGPALSAIAGPALAAPAGVAATLDIQAQMAAEAAKRRAADPVAQAVAYIDSVAAMPYMQSGHAIGFPCVGGAAAQAVAAIRGIALEGHGFAGRDYLGGMTLTDPSQLIGLAGELARVTGRPFEVAPPSPPPMAPLTPPDAPTAPPAAPAPAPSGIGTSPAAAPPPPTDDKPRRGRKKADPQVALSQVMPAGGAAPAQTPADGVSLFVGCMPSLIDVAAVKPYVDQIAAALCRQYGGDDVRMAPKDGPLGFGAWRGAMGAAGRDAINRGFIPPGCYYADDRDEVVAAFVDGVASTVELCVRSTR